MYFRNDAAKLICNVVSPSMNDKETYVNVFTAYLKTPANTLQLPTTHII